jgi:dihydrofolate reductase
MENNRKLVLYIAMSLDGYIATLDNDISFLSLVEKEGEDYGYQAFMESIDTVILGRKTYQKVADMGYDYAPECKTVYVITRTPRPSKGDVHFYTESLKTLVNTLKNEKGKNIFCDGGAEIVNELLKDNLIDEFMISVIPVLLGNGIRLFRDGHTQKNLQFISAKYFEKGLVQLHYSKKK